MKNILLAALASFIITYIVSLVIFPALKNLKARQTILHYVEEHKAKAGTPTMGGIFVVLGILISALAFLRTENQIALVSIAITAGFGIIGFLDDFIKIKFRRNMGLRAYQKAAAQLAVALIAAIFVYKNNLIGTTIAIPFSKETVDIGVFIIPLVVLVFIATTNGVNLTDGLDGLAGGVSFVYMSVFSVVIFIAAEGFNIDGNLAASGEYQNLAVFSAVVAGAVLCFLCYNNFPAKIFMGDTGALALGGAAASVAVFSRNSLYIPIIGIMFVLSCISVIIQVLYFKRTKKRVFLMAPLHHHFQKKGHGEPKIVFFYMTITLLAGLLCLAFLV